MENQLALCMYLIHMPLPKTDTCEPFLVLLYLKVKKKPSVTLDCMFKSPFSLKKAKSNFLGGYCSLSNITQELFLNVLQLVKEVTSLARYNSKLSTNVELN